MPSPEFGMAERAVLVLILWAAGLCSCAEYGPVPGAPSSADGAVNLSPDDGAIVDTTAPELRVSFRSFLDPDTLPPGGEVELRSGSRVVAVRARWDILDRAVIATPVDPLVPGLRYEWTFSPEETLLLGGWPISSPEPRSFTVSPTATDAPRDGAAPPTFDELVPVFEEHCGCHYDGTPPVLDRSVVGARSAVLPERWLVRPWEPAQSYLVQKLLPQYPDRFGTVMPPPWDGAEPLDPEALRAVIDWIAAGAP
jgi:hypothetical protein